MAIINSVVSFLLKKRIHQIDLFIKYPHEVQSDWFRKLVAAGVETAYGQQYNFADILSVEDFKRLVPLNDYETLKPWIKRIRNGEQYVLWNTEIKWFAKSSGTSNDKSKFIPMSKESLEECHYNAGKDMLSMYYSLYPESDVLDGKSLAMGGSQRPSDLPNASFSDGDLSAIMMDNLPLWANIRRTPDISVALMDEWESKIEKMAQITSKEDVRSLAGVPSWTLLLLRHVLKVTGKKNISEVWPNLKVFFHGGVSFDPYQKQFQEIIPDSQMQYFEIYNASEGFFGIQDQRDSDGMLLMLDYGIFYEFLPLSEIGKNNPQTVSLEDVELGVNYALVISTNAGLWRYTIGDTIMFISLNPYRIRVTGRVKNFINLAGEELIIDNAEKALSVACNKTNAQIQEYTAGPFLGGELQKSSHEWIIEFDSEPKNTEYFKEVFDTALKSSNSDYEAKRYKDMILDFPKITFVPKGTFYKWMKKRGKLGGQNKVPRLSNNRRYLDDLLKLINDKTDK